ncbi:MAG TPA: phytanoyl-CoA dioxygenase family protein [Eoetvoesiella sp.]|uniref:phytanoyl-CoA dioxygenase family protein n=1 Tax=Eoetvoesiella sp. TaxID=1966355 RepID=UPI002CE1353A|nr:phytanoyl-CoA dioxygenase family protein [Eoetvoesiella sp.]HWK61606.1 phytanoyl-CoA dioxygenase family protein [Eoetvoesiella sp.]
MISIKMPLAKLNKLIREETFSSEEINEEILDELGFFVLRNFFSEQLVGKYKKYYDDYKVSPEFDRTPYHLTEVKFSLENPLAGMLFENEFKELVARFFDGNVGLYNIRIVKKDHDDKSPVFLHQDIGYQYGSFNRYSVFIPLTECNNDNGGLIFIPGSHKFGYLGDVGEINDILPKDLARAAPKIFPSDLVVMNSCLWHMSGQNHTGKERVYYDIHINHAADPASKLVILGEANREYELNYDRDFVFKSSRTQRLQKFYQSTKT